MVGTKRRGYDLRVDVTQRFYTIRFKNMVVSSIKHFPFTTYNFVEDGLVHEILNERRGLPSLDYVTFITYVV